MNNWKKALITAVCAALSVGVASPVAHAVTVGGSGTSATTDCTAGTVYVNASSSGLISTSGVLTSWTVNRNVATAGQVALKTVTVPGWFADPDLSSGSVYGSSALETASGTGPKTFSSRFFVSSGQRLALWHATTQKCTVAAGESVYTGTSAIVNPSGGDPGTAFNLAGPDAGPTATAGHLVVSATVEPDVDGDVFGDTTQDNCPTVYGANNGCPPVYTPPPPPPPVCKVPEVKGKTKKAATSAIFAAGCKQSTTKLKKVKKFTKKKKKGRVASQTVKAGSVLPFGSTVGITVYAKK